MSLWVEVPSASLSLTSVLTVCAGFAIAVAVVGYSHFVAGRLRRVGVVIALILITGKRNGMGPLAAVWYVDQIVVFGCARQGLLGTHLVFFLAKQILTVRVDVPVPQQGFLFAWQLMERARDLGAVWVCGR